MIPALLWIRQRAAGVRGRGQVQLWRGLETRTMHECWKETLRIDGLPYDVLKVDSTQHNQPERIVLIIPGLPGYAHLLETFAKCLFEKLRATHAIWVLSYCRFCEEDCDNEISMCKPLELEVEHKLRFLESAVPLGTRITLVGHSIGAHMTLSVLQILKGVKKRKVLSRDPTLQEEDVPYRNFELYHQIDRCYLLFPVIERLEETPNGQKLVNTLYYLHYFFVLNAHVISKLPAYLRKRVIELLVNQGNGKVDPVLIEAGAQFLTPRYVHNLLEMAMDNVESIRKLESGGLKQCADKISVYFGESDGWCPPSYRENLLKKVPGIQSHVDQLGIPHMFFAQHSGMMASLLANHMKRQAFEC